MLKNIIISIFALTSFLVCAGNQTGKITMLYARAGDNLHLVALTGARINSPDCATKGYWLIKDENSVAGKSQFSQLLAAQLAGKTVELVGDNSCTRWGDGENISIVLIKD